MIKKGHKQRYVFLFLLFSLAVLFIGSFPVYSYSYHIFSDTIQKSANDQRQYQVIQLPNQMRVLLVSDPNAIKSLGAIAIPVGSLHDPVEQQGLAHYTEHMVLMGSKNYPKPDGFSEFLSKYAGRYNASTALYRTAYYFEVENSALKEALNRLADAIAYPLLNQNYANKERHAINQEATLARSNDGFRMQQVDAETMNQNHPAALFSVGNLETLSDKKYGVLHDALVSFYERYYSANLMRGVVYGKAPLVDLANLALQSFGQIKNKERQIEPITAAALTPKELSKIIYLEPAQPKRVLYLQFPIPNNLSDFKSKSDIYIGYLLSNQSEGTLANTLIKQGLIDTIDTSYDPNRYGNSGTFNIIVNLTQRGLAEKDEVIASIFNYIHLIKQRGIDKKYYREMANVLKLDFKYQSLTRDMGYVEWLADQMLLYPIRYILNADYVTDRFNPSQIRQKLEQLTPENARVWVIASNQYYDKEAYFMKAPYRIVSLSGSQKSLWENPPNKSQFVLPELNPFIATQLSIIKQEKVKKTLYQFNPQGNLMYFPSHYFANEPKGALILSLRRNHNADTAKQQVVFPMLDYLVTRSMTKLKYQASVAGVGLNQFADNGLMLSASGYSQHLPKMLEAMLQHFRDITISESDMELARSWYLQQLDAADDVSSYAFALQPITALNILPYTERDTRRQLVSSITANDLLEFRDALLYKSVPYLMSIGNLDQKTIRAFYETLKTNMSSDARFTLPPKLTIVESGKALLRQCATHSDNALGLIYLPQTGKLSVNAKAKSMLLTKIITPWFYKQLRSEEQLAYALFTFPITIGDSNGFGFLIQSNQYDPSYVYRRYRAFFPHVLIKLKSLSDAEFAEYKRGLLSAIREVPQTFGEEVGTYLDDFTRSNFTFSSHQKLITSVQAITKQDLITFYRKLIFDDAGFSILSQVVGFGQTVPTGTPNGYILYPNAMQLQQKLMLSNRKK